MKIQVFSDIHLEFLQKTKDTDYIKNQMPKIIPLAEYLFLLGDIGQLHIPSFKPFIDYCSSKWKYTFYILGNHEFYSNSKIHSKLPEDYIHFFGLYGNVILLNDQSYDLEIGGFPIRIYGSTLWSNPRETTGLNDFNNIKMKNEKDWTVKIDREYFKNLHDDCTNNLIAAIKTANSENRKLIVATHFPPLRYGTSHPKFDNEDISRKSYFSNDFQLSYFCDLNISEKDFYKNILMWISGHTHYSYSFTHNNTRFISNQLGYPFENDSNFNRTGIFYL